MSETVFSQGKLAYRVDEAVKASGLGRSFLYEHMASGDLPSIRIGGRRLILHDDLVAFLRGSRASVSKTLTVAEQPADIRRNVSRRSTAQQGQMEFPWRD